jgi:hypothetical protein
VASNVTIGGLPFVCVPWSEADFTDFAAIYVIICVVQGGSWTVLDVGQSGQVGSRIDTHDREGCWKRNCTNGNIWVCVYPMPSSRFSKQDREKVEADLRTRYGPPCGKR